MRRGDIDPWTLFFAFFLTSLFQIALGYYFGSRTYLVIAISILFSVALTLSFNHIYVEGIVEGMNRTKSESLSKKFSNEKSKPKRFKAKDP